MNPHTTAHTHRLHTALMRRILVLLTLFAMGVARAVIPFTVQDIQVDGLQRVDSATVFAYLPIKVGDVANDANIRNSVQSLYSTGLFADVNVQAQGNVLVLTLTERPFIADVTFAGNKEIASDELKKIAKEIGISEGRAYDKALIARFEQEVKNAYLSRSRYGLTIKAISSPIERNRVNVLFEMAEGSISKIKDIKILGNKKFSQKQIIEEMNARTPSWSTWFSKADRYAKEKLSADLELIRSFYYNRGYFEFVIESSQVTLSPDKQDVFLTIVVNEGEQFTMNKVFVTAANPQQAADLEYLVKIKEGQLFNGEQFNQTMRNISTRLGELGYANAQVNPVPNIDYDKRAIDFDMQVETGSRTYVRKINVMGNKTTRDEVIRREMLQLEAAWYDGERIKQSRDKIERLGFFKEVNLEAMPIDGKPDQIDLNITVVEKPTGSFTLGVGFNSTDKISFNAGISRDNVFGTGNNLAFSLNTASLNRNFSLTATDPYFTDSGISRTIDAYSRVNKLVNGSISLANVTTHGLSTRFGFPVTDSDVVYFGLGAEYTGIKKFDTSPVRYTELYDRIKGSSTYPLLTLGWGKDTRDSGLSPTKGTLKRFNVETALGNEIAYNKINYQYQLFAPIGGDFIFASNVDAGYGLKLGSKTYPFFKNYYVGGVGSVRGYQGSTIGPVDDKGDPLGGTKKLVLNTEIQAPMPGTGKDKSVKLFAFVDGGYTWSDTDKIKTSDMRWAGGFGLSWQSPIGPLKFSYGYPFKKHYDDLGNLTDKTQKFQFQIGTGF
jgi:outer membrane protein insertion porin family